MAAKLILDRTAPRRVLRRAWPLLLVVPGSIGATLWWLNEPLGDPADVSSVPAASPTARAEAEAVAAPAPAAPSWPEGRLEGEPAKVLLNEIVLDVQARLDRINTYTATFRKLERMKGKLGPEHTLAMKARDEPFGIYFKFLAPKAGKEVVFAEGRHDGHAIVHNGDWTRKLIPRLRVLPDSDLALADSRHPITEAGLHNLVRKLVGFRKLDLTDPHAETVLDWVEGPDGRPWPRSLHDHTAFTTDRPFARVEVLYDPETLFPRQIACYDWPSPGHSGDLELAERYRYDDIQLGAPLSDLDFDPSNPAYEFMRF